MFNPAVRVSLFLTFIALLMCAPAMSQVTAKPAAAAERDGSHDFDFEFGEWRVRHRVKRGADGTWSEFDGTASVRPLMTGAANVEDNQFNRPEGVTHGIALRAYDPKTREWAIWWVDGRDPLGTLDPPTKGRFEDGVGKFYWKGEYNGKSMQTRFTWSHITKNSARWEQAYSYDDGKTWDTNWVMEFRRKQG
jgi:hypothetical protein